MKDKVCKEYLHEPNTLPRNIKRCFLWKVYVVPLKLSPVVCACADILLGKSPVKLLHIDTSDNFRSSCLSLLKSVAVLMLRETNCFVKHLFQMCCSATVINQERESFPTICFLATHQKECVCKHLDKCTQIRGQISGCVMCLIGKRGSSCFRKCKNLREATEP